MTRFATIAGALSLAGVVSGAAAQQRPDFSGVWARATEPAAAGPTVAATGDASFRRGDMGSGWGSPLTITQEPNRLIIAFPYFSEYDLQPPIRLTFALDGSVSMNTVTFGHTSSEVRSTAAWTDSTLVITTTYPGPSGADARRLTANVRHAIRLESVTVLAVETTRSVGPGTATPPIRTTYTKR